MGLSQAAVDDVGDGVLKGSGAFMVVSPAWEAVGGYGSTVELDGREFLRCCTAARGGFA
jgi:hypothetical protein